MRRMIGLGLASALAACSIGQDVSTAEKGVATFHELLGKDRIDAIIATSGPELTAGSAKARFSQLLTVVRRKLGSPKSFKQVGWNDQVTTGGHFISLNYQSSYEKGDAAENFVFRIDDGKAVLAGYHVNSDALILN